MSHFVIVFKSEFITLTAAHTTFYYSENARSTITSSSEHLNGHQIAAQAATQAGLAYWLGHGVGV